MTYVLQPFEDSMEQLPRDLQNSLKIEFYQQLAKVNYDLPKLFDLVTNTCDNYFSETFLGKLTFILCVIVYLHAIT